MVAFDLDGTFPAEAWLSLEESDRVVLVREAHERVRAPVGQNPDAHATLHVAVENRLAAGDRAVVAAYERFRGAGIGRHTTVHALASVVTRHMMAVLESREGFDQETADRDFDALDPAAWTRKR